MSTLKQICITEFPLEITKGTAMDIISYLKVFELRDENPLAFNTPMLGVNLARFYNKDKVHIFDTFGIDQQEFAKKILTIKSIDKKFHVISNPFNLFMTWVLYNLINDKKLTSRMRIETILAIGKLWNYAFFTSSAAHFFPYKAKEDVMRYTIDNLSGKYSIKQPATNTWKLVIEARVLTLLETSSIHYKTLQTYTTDAQVLYLITDMQSRLRDNIKNIAIEYYKNEKHGVKISEYGLTDEIDGKKVIRNVIDSFDSLIIQISGIVLNTTKLIDNELIKITVKLNDNLREDMFRDMLTRFSNMALGQYRKHNDDEIIKKDKHTIFVGYRILTSNIIQKTYRKCILRKIDLKSKLKILEATKNMYSNSRINDQDLLDIKNSVEYFIEHNSDTRRDQTITALKLGFITYIILLSMKNV